MGIVLYSYMTVYSFLMGWLWFNAFILLGLIMRKLRYPIMFSVAPLLVVLFLSLLRMLFTVDLGFSAFVHSEVVYPTLVSIAEFEFMPFRIVGIPLTVYNVFIILWVAGAIILLVKLIRQFNYSRHMVKYVFSGLPRCEHAENMLKSMIDSNNDEIRVFKTFSVDVPSAAGTMPYIILPDVDFSQDELKVILLHEWKHHIDRDYITLLVAHILCKIFWWNPFIIVLKRNVEFALELKCDYFAMSSTEDFGHFKSVVKRLGESLRAKASDSSTEMKNLISYADEMADRYSIQDIRNYDSRIKRTAVNAFFAILAGGLLVFSYMFLVLPAFWEAPDVSATAECFTDEYLESGNVFWTEDIFAVDNGDGTFSLYMDGEFVQYVDENSEMMPFLQIRQRCEDRIIY